MPALEIRLLPPLLEQRPGNAALLYAKAFLLFSRVEISEEAAYQALAPLLMAAPPESDEIGCMRYVAGGDVAAATARTVE